ncbi:MAG: hypothetical protein MZV49_07350 [Rhodopseudomonas palustris]|nr:hypothetical protein [Rhodopseudomonas palustris]
MKTFAELLKLRELNFSLLVWLERNQRTSEALVGLEIKPNMALNDRLVSGLSPVAIVFRQLLIDFPGCLLRPQRAEWPD